MNRALASPTHARATWFCLGLLALIVASFWSLDLQWGQFFSPDAAASMGRFVREFLPAGHLAGVRAQGALGHLGDPGHVRPGHLAGGSARPGSRLACGARSSADALALQRPALSARVGLGQPAADLGRARAVCRHPGAGAAHRRRVGRLFAEAMENAPPGPAIAQRTQGVGAGRVFLYATLPQVLPQLLSYTLYRWENNIRAAAVLGVVGAGGLGQLLAFHMGLFNMPKTATVLLAMLGLVVLVDGVSYASRRWLTR